ncbi:hypothetical protein D3C79_1079540 [compost metagenome]
MPTISSWPSAATSPTNATTLEVPMSRPTIILPLCTLAMLLTFYLIHCTATVVAAGASTGVRQATARPLG